MASAPDNNALVCLGPVKRGRQETYTQETADEICERIASGEILSGPEGICADEDMPALRTVTRWLNKHPNFAAQYSRAREQQADLEADQIRALGDNLAILPEHKRIMVDTRKWRAERLNRRVYGNSVKHEHQHEVYPAHGAAGLPPGLDWIAGQLPGPQAGAGPEPGDGGMGEE